MIYSRHVQLRSPSRYFVKFKLPLSLKVQRGKRQREAASESQHRLFTPRRPRPTFHRGVTFGSEELIEKLKKTKEEVTLSIPQCVHNAALKIEPAAADWHPCHMFQSTRRSFGAKRCVVESKQHRRTTLLCYLKTGEVAKNSF